MTHRPPPPPIKTILLAGSATAVGLYIVDAVLFTLVAPVYFTVPGMRDNPDMTFMIIGYIVAGFIFTYVYAHWVWSDKLSEMRIKGRNANGFWYGAVLSLVVFLPGAFINYSLFTDWDLGPQLVEVVFRFFEFGLIGVMVARIFPKPE